MEIAVKRKKRAFRLKWPTYEENKSNATVSYAFRSLSLSFSLALLFGFVLFCFLFF